MRRLFVAALVILGLIFCLCWLFDFIDTRTSQHAAKWDDRLTYFEQNIDRPKEGNK